MATYKIIVNDRNYSKYYIIKNKTNPPILKDDNIKELNGLENNTFININPIQNKLFNEDIFTFENNNITIIKSNINKQLIIPGVLILKDNKTFGRTNNSKNSKLLYKCIPYDKHLPIFLVPYSFELGFSKVQTNKYVIFNFDNWEHKHPCGKLYEVLGNVDDNSLIPFYNYQLYSKKLHHSIRLFKENITEILKKNKIKKIINEIYSNECLKIEKRTNEFIFSIDPENCMDIDDCISITHINNIPNIKFKISVYISNVAIWLEHFNLWNNLTDRVSTIYFPNKKENMLPSMLSNNICSLLEKEDRFAFSMDIFINNNNTIEDNKIEYNNVLIKNNKNFIYEEPNLLNNSNYINLFKITKILNANIIDSHDVVEFWMVKMNTLCGSMLFKKNVGLFRSSTQKIIEPTNPLYLNEDNCGEQKYLENQMFYDLNISNNAKTLLKNWNNTTCNYILPIQTNGNTINNIKHEIMNIDTYIHVTSPIRRLPDLLNQVLFIKNILNIELINSQLFLEKWLNNIDYINTSIKSIRKIQNETLILYNCINNPCLLNNIYNGIIFDKQEIILNNTEKKYNYMVYLDEIKILTKFKSLININNYTILLFKVFLFQDEDCVKRKIRLQLYTNND